MAWLMRGGQVLASLDVADGLIEHAAGFAGRRPADGALLLRSAIVVHSIGTRAGVDVAFLDDDLVVTAARTLRRFSFALPRPRARGVLQAEAGAFARWGLAVGDKLEIRE